MKQQIGDLIYDTEKATKICEDKEALVTTALYKTGSGRYFFHITGIFDKSDDSSGEIKKCVLNKAKDFFNKHGDAREYEKVFGKAPQDA